MSNTSIANTVYIVHNIHALLIFSKCLENLKLINPTNAKMMKNTPKTKNLSSLYTKSFNPNIDKINCDPENIILIAYVQFPISSSHPVIHELISEYFSLLKSALK